MFQKICLINSDKNIELSCRNLKVVFYDLWCNQHPVIQNLIRYKQEILRNGHYTAANSLSRKLLPQPREGR
jgi:hypothetical protein